MFRFLALLVISSSFHNICSTRDYLYPVDYYAKEKADRARGHIYKDLQYLLGKLRKNRDRLKQIYLGVSISQARKKLTKQKYNFIELKSYSTQRRI